MKKAFSPTHSVLLALASVAVLILVVMAAPRDKSIPHRSGSAVPGIIRTPDHPAPLVAPALPPKPAAPRSKAIIKEQHSNLAAYREAVNRLNASQPTVLSRIEPGLSSVAQSVVNARKLSPSNLAKLSVPGRAQVDTQGAIQVYVRTKASPEDSLEALEKAGLKAERAVPEMHLVQGWAPAEKMEALAAIDSVAGVELPDYARLRTGPVNSQGDSVHKADLVRALAAPGPYTGTGIKVGIISDGCTNRATAVAAGELPAAGITMHPTLLVAGDEGTAMGQIIYDLAPGAQLFGVGPSTSADMPTAISWLISQGCQVIVDDTFYPGQGWFEDGSVAVAARNAVTSSGRVYVSAAGNEADDHYQGLYSPITGDTLHDYKSGTGEDGALDLNLPAGGTVTIYLQWNDQFGASGNNYDLYLGDPATSTIVASSTTVQSGTGIPREIVSYTNSGTTTKALQVLINKASGVAKTVELFVLGAGIVADDDAVISDSIVGTPAVEEVISVGAMYHADPGLDAVESFSAAGPSTISFPSSQTRQTPTLIGVDRVSVMNVGTFGTEFWGTSAAAPHIAAICALMLQKNPAATPTQIRTALTGGAIDKGTVGFDYDFGYGLADALAAVNLVPVPEIAVEQPSGTDLTDGTSTIAYGSSNVGVGVTKTFTIRNTGTASLTGLAVTKDGTNSADFTLGSLGATSLAAGGSTTFDVTFTPAASGSRTAAIHIASNDADENPFDIALTGTGVDPQVSVTVAASSMAEDAAGTMVFTFTRTGSTAAALTANFTVGGTATLTSDYTQSGAATFTATTGTVTFAAGSATATVAVDPVTDTTVESNETIILTVAAGSGYTAVSPTSATATINNDDTDISVSASPSFANEDMGIFTFTFTRTGVTTGAITVNFSVSGTATFGSDYTQSGATTFGATSGTVTFGDGVTTKTVQVNSIADFVAEADETLSLTVTAGTGYNPGSLSSANVLILNDEAVISVTVSPSSMSEDAAGTLVYTFTRTGYGGTPLTVGFSVGGTATFGTDYTQSGAATFSAGGGTVQFGLGTPSVSVTIDPIADSTAEGDETVILSVTSSPGNYLAGSPSSATGTILNDDATSVSVAISPSSMAEDAAGTMACTFTRTGSTASALTANFSVSGTATLTTDYTQSGATTFSTTSGTVTFAAGSATAVINLDPVADTLYEQAETITLTLTTGAGYSIGSPGNVTGTINNDDTAPQIRWATSSSSVAENASTFGITATLSAVSGSDASAHITLSGSAANGTDYTVAGLPMEVLVTIPAGQTSATLSFNLTNDTVDETDETVVATMDTTPPPQGATLGSPSVHTVTIIDDDNPEIVVQQPVGTNLIDGTASISFGTSAIGSPVALTFTVSNTGTAALTGLALSKDGTNSADFALGSLGATSLAPTASTTFTVTFTPSAAGSRTAAIHLANNDTDENPFDIQLTGTGGTPEIAVEQPLGTDLTDGSATIALGGAGIGLSGGPTITFTIRSVGTGTLSGIAITKNGTNAPDFIVGTPGATSITAGGSTTFTVTLAPAAGSSGTRSAALHIASNDADENPFDITLSGLALSTTGDTDGDGMNDWGEFNLASLGFDWQVGNPTQVSTYFAAANSNGLYTASQVQSLNVSTPLLQRNPLTGSFTVTLGLEKSADLSTWNSLPFAIPQVTVNGQGKLEFQFTVPDNAAFFRLGSN